MYLNICTLVFQHLYFDICNPEYFFEYLCPALVRGPYATDIKLSTKLWVACADILHKGHLQIDLSPLHKLYNLF